MTTISTIITQHGPYQQTKKTRRLFLNGTFCKYCEKPFQAGDESCSCHDEEIETVTCISCSGYIPHIECGKYVKRNDMKQCHCFSLNTSLPSIAEMERCEKYNLELRDVHMLRQSKWCNNNFLHMMNRQSFMLQMVFCIDCGDYKQSSVMPVPDTMRCTCSEDRFSARKASLEKMLRFRC